MVRSLTQAAGVVLSGVHVVPSCLHDAISKMAVAMTKVGCQFLCPRHKPLAQDATSAQECTKAFILGNVVPSFPHQVDAQLKLCSNDVVVDFLGCIKHETGSTSDVQSKMGPVLKILDTVRASGESFVCIPGMFKCNWMLQKDSMVLRSMECKKSSALEGGLAFRAVVHIRNYHE